MNIQNRKSLFKKGLMVPFFCLSLLLFTACGKDGNYTIVKDIKFETKLVEGDVVLDLSIILDLGNMYMTAITLPVFNPNEPGKKYGELRFMAGLNGLTEIGGNINLSNVARIAGGEATLPNGSRLPIGGLNGVEVIELQLDSIHSKIYLGLNNTTTFFGFAVAIKEFGVLNSYVGEFNLFPGFSIEGVVGNVGVFSGSEEYGNGLGFFLDLSNIINAEIIQSLLRGDVLDQSKFAELKSISPKEISSRRELDFFQKSESKKKEKKLKKVMYKMSKGKKLELNPIKD